MAIKKLDIIGEIEVWRFLLRKLKLTEYSWVVNIQELSNAYVIPSNLVTIGD